MDSDTGNNSNGNENHSASENMRPGFMGGAGGGEVQHGLNKDDPGAGKEENGAKKDLANVEKAAEENGVAGSKGLDDGIKNSVTGARENEENVGGFYKGSGKNSSSKVRPTGFWGIVKKGGPLYAIFFTIFIAGGMMSGAQFFQPFSLVAQFQETFGSMEISANRRSERFFRAQMETGRTKSPYNVFGSKFSISKKQAAELKKQGIEFVEDFEGTGVKVMKFEDADGTIHLVTGNDADAEKLGNLSRFNSDDVKYKADAVEFKKAYMNNSKFYSSYNKGAMSWRGAIANWFGTNTKSFLQKNKLTRNLFANYLDKVSEAEEGTGRLKVAQDMIAKGTEEIGGGGVKRTNVENKGGWEEYGMVGDERQYRRQIGVDDQGNPIYEYKESHRLSITQRLKSFFSKIISFFSGSEKNSVDGGEFEGEDFEPSTSDETHEKFNRSDIGDVKEKLMSIANKYSGGANGVAGAANFVCVGVNVMGGISLLVQAAQALQVIHLTTAYFEVFDKTKAGFGNEAPISELMNTLNVKKENEHVSLVRSGTGGSVSEDGISGLTDEKTTSNKTAMQSSGIAALYSGGPVDANDPSVKSFNFTGNIKNILWGAGTSMNMFKGCAVARIGAAVINAATDGLSGLKVAGCIAGLVGTAFTFGASASLCSAFAAEIAIRVGISIAVSTFIMGIVSTVTPIVAKMLTRDLISDIGGEDLGNALALGANMYLGSTHRANGGSWSNRQKYKKFAVAQQSVIAENAKYERENLSPFDLTSKNTFMGSIMTQMMGLLSSTTIMDVVTAGGATLGSSLIAMGPTASAYDISATLPTEEEYEETCPYLASIGAIGDAYCNPYVITDLSTIEYDPQYDVIDKLADPNGDGDTSDGNFEESDDEDANVKVKQDSKLLKYAILCDQRESMPGIADLNIANAVTTTGSWNTGVTTVIGSVPIVGDIIDITDNKAQLNNMGYISGESCVAGNTSKAADSPDWEEAKLYQRFIEDQSLGESEGIFEKSAITLALEEYYERNPLDNSYEGILARYSGLPKDDVIAFLDIIDYCNYIASYKPSERYAFGEPVVEGSHEIMFDDEDVLGGEIVLLGETIYADVRNRSFAI